MHTPYFTPSASSVHLTFHMAKSLSWHVNAMSHAILQEHLVGDFCPTLAAQKLPPLNKYWSSSINLCHHQRFVLWCLVTKYTCVWVGVPCGDSLAYVTTSSKHILICHLTQLATRRNHLPKRVLCTSVWLNLWLPLHNLATFAAHKVVYSLPCN